VGYVGNVGIHQTSTYDINQVPNSAFLLGSFLSGGSSTTSYTTGPAGPAGPLGTACQPGGVYNAGNKNCTYTTPSINTLRPAGNFGTINYFTRDGHSTYHSLQVMFRSKLSNFSTFNAAYTWSHTIADIEEDAANGGASQGSFTDVGNLRLDRGNATINRPNIFVFNEVFFLPKLAHRGAFLRETAGGWEFNTIFTAENGNSISIYQSGINPAGNTATTQINPNASPLQCTHNGAEFPCALNSLTGTGYTNTQRPNRVSGVSCNSGVSGLQIYNPAAFTLTGFQIGTVGNAPRGACQGPHYVNGDLELSKNWQFKERFRLRFSMDFFNAFNHPNFDAGSIQGVNYWNNGAGVYCGAATTVTVGSATKQQYEPCSPTNGVVSAYGATNSKIGGAAPLFGQAQATKPARELQYGLKLTF